MLTFSIQDGGGIFDCGCYFEIHFLTFFYMKENNIIDRLHLETLQIIDMIWI